MNKKTITELRSQILNRPCKTCGKKMDCKLLDHTIWLACYICGYEERWKFNTDKKNWEREEK